MKQYLNFSKQIFWGVAILFIFHTVAFAQDSEDPKFKRLGSYNAGGKKWVNVLVQADTTERQLIKLAKRLHKENPNAFFHIFDDDSKIKEYVDWDRNYPNSNYPFPEKWVLKHFRGNIRKMFIRGGLQWQLTDQYGSEISVLE